VGRAPGQGDITAATDCSSLQLEVSMFPQLGHARRAAYSVIEKSSPWPVQEASARRTCKAASTVALHSGARTVRRELGSETTSDHRKKPWRQAATKRGSQRSCVAQLELGVSRVGAPEDWDAGVGVFPECQELFVDGERPDTCGIGIRSMRGFQVQGGGASNSQMSQRSREGDQRMPEC